MLASILGIKAKWMFFDELMSPDQDDSKILQAEVDLFEEKGQGTIATQ